MKSRLTLRSLFYLGCLFSLFFCFSCGDTEDEQEATNPTNNTFLDAPSELWFQLEDEDWEKLKDAEQWIQLTAEDWKNLKAEDWEKLKDEDWIRLTDAEVEELMNLELPPGDFKERTWEEARKYSHARLFQKFGDIPQVRYTVEFERRPSRGLVIVTLELAKQHLAKSAATYFLVPTENHKHWLEDSRKRLKVIAAREEVRLLEQLRIEDPETWAKGMYAFLIRKHGKIQEVNTIVNFLRKLELNLPRTDAECRIYYFEAYDALYDDINTASVYEFYAMLEALYQIRPFVKNPPSPTLEKYREARAEGISFYDIEWDED